MKRASTIKFLIEEAGSDFFMTSLVVTQRHVSSRVVTRRHRLLSLPQREAKLFGSFSFEKKMTAAKLAIGVSEKSSSCKNESCTSLKRVNPAVSFTQLILINICNLSIKSVLPKIQDKYSVKVGPTNFK